MVVDTINETAIPVCSNCKTKCNWDISLNSYFRDKIFWDNWECQDCKPEGWLVSTEN